MYQLQSRFFRECHAHMNGFSIWGHNAGSNHFDLKSTHCVNILLLYVAVFDISVFCAEYAYCMQTLSLSLSLSISKYLYLCSTARHFFRRWHDGMNKFRMCVCVRALLCFVFFFHCVHIVGIVSCFIPFCMQIMFVSYVAVVDACISKRHHVMRMSKEYDIFLIFIGEENTT